MSDKPNKLYRTLSQDAKRTTAKNDLDAAALLYAAADLAATQSLIGAIQRRESLTSDDEQLLNDIRETLLLDNFAPFLRGRLKDALANASEDIIAFKVRA